MNDWSEREIRRQSEQRRLELLSGNGARNKFGQFATPPCLALEIMQYLRTLWVEREVRFLEPGFGTGAFYSALRQVFPEEIIREAVGIEVDSRYVESAISVWRGAGIQIIEGDFTRQKPADPDKRFNLIVTNPPYVRHHHLGSPEKTRLKRRVLGDVGVELNGLAGLYCYFLLLADQWLAEEGVSAWLIPSEFMDVNYGAAVKHYLTRNVKLLHIHRYCPLDVQFNDALVSSAVVVFEKSSPAPNHRVCFSFAGSLLEPQLVREVSLKALKVSDKWNKYAVFGAQAKEDKDETPTLGDLFTIKRGLATGANSFFILEREQAVRLGIPPEFVKPILPSPRMLSSDIIEADENGFPQLKMHRVLIDCNLPEEEVEQRFPGFWKYLQTGKARKADRGYLASRRSPWYSQENRPPPPFLCTYMGRTNNGRKPFRFIWNKSKATAHNVYLLLYPKAFLREALQSDPTLEARVFAALRKIDTNRFMGEGRVYGGGLYKMEPKELAQISSESLSDVLKRFRRTRGGAARAPFFSA